MFCAVGNMSSVRLPVPFSSIEIFLSETVVDGNFIELGPPVNSSISISVIVKSLKLKSFPAAKLSLSIPSPPLINILASLPSAFTVKFILSCPEPELIEIPLPAELNAELTPSIVILSSPVPDVTDLTP